MGRIKFCTIPTFLSLSGKLIISSTYAHYKHEAIRISKTKNNKGHSKKANVHWYCTFIHTILHHATTAHLWYWHYHSMIQYGLMYVMYLGNIYILRS